MIPLVLLAGCRQPPGEPAWVDSFGYSTEALHGFQVGDFGFPYVPVTIRSDTIWLPFDTGNMVGLTLESSLFQSLGLPCADQWNLRDSGGRLTSTSCVASGIAATVFGVRHDSISVFEFNHESLPGLVGPGALPGHRFTLDYDSRVLAVDNGLESAAVPGFVSLPLIRSGRHPRLILVMGRVDGRQVLVEIDTGKSRTTVDRKLVETLSLNEAPGGVELGTVELGPWTWSIDAAREVDTSGVSRGLEMPIAVGIGSDLLADFVFTVNYRTGRIWIENPAAESAAPDER